MPPTSFGTPQENNDKRSVETNTEEMSNVLKNFGFIDNASALSSEDYKLVAMRVKTIKEKRLMPKELAISFAFIDQMIAKEEGSETYQEHLLSAVNTDLVAPLLSDPLLSTNEEFLQTVVNASVSLYRKGGYSSFSDAMFEALKKREIEYSATPDLHGQIDGGENIVQPSDKYLI